MIADNPFQRETQALRSKHSQELIERLYRIVKLNDNRQVDEALQTIDQFQQFLQLGEKNQEQDLKKELLFLKGILLSLTGQKQLSELCDKHIFENDLNMDSDFSMRICLKNICAKIRQKQEISEEDINKLEDLMGQEPKNKNQILFKLTGAKSISRMKELTYQEIDELTKNQISKAIKFQIGGDWKFFVGDSDAAIRMKTEAMRLWSLQNMKDKASIAEKQQKQIITLVSDPEAQSVEGKNLLLIKAIVSMIEDFGQNERKIELIQKRKNAMRFMIASVIKKINQEKQMNSRPLPNKSSRGEDKKKSQLKSSFLKKQDKLEQKLERGKQFLKEGSKDNYFCIDFIENSKFSREMMREFAQKMGIFNKIIKKQYRNFRDILEENMKRIKEQKSQSHENDS